MSSANIMISNIWTKKVGETLNNARTQMLPPQLANQISNIVPSDIGAWAERQINRATVFIRQISSAGNDTENNCNSLLTNANNAEMFVIF